MTVGASSAPESSAKTSEPRAVHSLGNALVWPAHLGPSNPTRQWVDGFIRSACEQPSVDAVIAIGSLARGRSHHRSDVDLIVVFHGEPPGFERPEIDIDIRLVEREHVDVRISSGHDLLGWAVRFGRTVCERNHYWQDVVNRWSGCLPLPSAEVARQRAWRARARARDLVVIGDREAAAELVQAMLTQEARAKLIDASVYPASRPELPDQLREIGEIDLATELEQSISGTWERWHALSEYAPPDSSRDPESRYDRETKPVSRSRRRDSERDSVAR